MANLGNKPAIGHTFDLEFNVHHRSAGSTHAGGPRRQCCVPRAGTRDVGGRHSYVLQRFHLEGDLDERKPDG
jgi:hypothetical protein